MRIGARWLASASLCLLYPATALKNQSVRNLGRIVDSTKAGLRRSVTITNTATSKPQPCDVRYWWIRRRTAPGPLY